MKTLDVVACVYNEADVLPEFLKQTCQVLDSLSELSWRLILVNDGSSDGSLALMEAACLQDPRIEVLDLSRNFGHEAALDAGLQAAGADAVVVMDADLEDPPGLIPKLVDQWSQGFEVVNARRRHRQDSWFKRATASAFYRLLGRLSGNIVIPKDVGNFRLLSRRVLEVLKTLPEQNRVFRVLVPYLGFSTCQVDFDRNRRPKGVSHYGLGSMVRLAVDGITSATTVPLKLVINLGFLVSALGFGYMTWVFISAAIGRIPVEGWASTVSIILFLGGIQLLSLGVLGEYIGRIFMEVKGRPGHVVRRHLRHSDQAGGGTLPPPPPQTYQPKP